MYHTTITYSLTSFLIPLYVSSTQNKFRFKNNLIRFTVNLIYVSIIFDIWILSKALKSREKIQFFT